MNQKKNYTLIVRIHQLLIGVLFIFSLFVKEDIKKVFWLIIATAALSLIIQSHVYDAKAGLTGDKVKKQE